MRDGVAVIPTLLLMTLGKGLRMVSHARISLCLIFGWLTFAIVCSAEEGISLVRLSEWRMNHISKKDERVKAILDVARPSLGVPYKWGGTQMTKGIDCSNFTWQLFRKMGFPYERFIGTQNLANWKKGNGLRKIDFDAAEPGDLLVYGYSKGKKWYGHVVVLIDLDGLHSGHKGLVLGAHGGDVDQVAFITYDGFNEGYYKNPRMKLVNVLRAEK